MPNTIGSNFGDVVLVPFPFTDQTAAKRRPAVVVSSDAYHRERPDVIVVAVTSRSGKPASVGDVMIEEWREASNLVREVEDEVARAYVRPSIRAAVPPWMAVTSSFFKPALAM